MVIKMRKWSWWQSESTATRKFKVSVKPILKLIEEEEDDDDDVTSSNKYVVIKIKWKGQHKSFHSKYKQELSSEKVLMKKGIIQWDEEDHCFENTCTFSTVPNQHDHHHKFRVWEIEFNVLYGEKMDSKGNMGVIGETRMNIAEIVGKTETSSSVNLPLSLQIHGVTIQATITVLLTFEEIKEHHDTTAISGGALDSKQNLTGWRRSLSQDEVRVDVLDKSTVPDATNTSVFTKSRTFTVSRTQLNSDKRKEGWFSWKNRGFSFKRAKTKEDKFDEKTETCCTNVNNRVDELENLANITGTWEVKEIKSRDGLTKFKASVFFASFDQCSDKAEGESACTALVAVISHWLHNNAESMPNRLEFNNLIIQGSSEWRKLSQSNVAYVNNFPNRHFDLETVLRADIGPVSISVDNSYVGFFDPEKFELLKGHMSFDDIWSKISSNADKDDEFLQRIYIVSWNDHFFVLKTEAKAYYIIDTLGERLYEGCNQAYILKFDDSVVMQSITKSNDKKVKDKEEILCSGKECCREFIKRFYAAIPLKELEEEEVKNTVSDFTLHKRLQIDFNYSCSSSPASSSTSSPISNMATSTSSSDPDKECNLQLKCNFRVTRL